MDNLKALVITQYLDLALTYQQATKRVNTNQYLHGRAKKGRFATDFDDLTKSESKFKENFHMSFETFGKLLALIEPTITPKFNNHHSDQISAKEKLAAVLEYFASGSMQRHIASVYRISKQRFGEIMNEVCDAISNALSSEIPLLDAKQMLDISNDFHSKWQFPNCCGAIGAKHVSVKYPKPGSLSYNNKNFNDVMLIAVADANYKFTYLDIGACGNKGDAGVFGECTLGKDILQNKLNFPKDKSIGPHLIPHFLVADDAFPLLDHIMKPYVPKRGTTLGDDEVFFNYRLCRSRNVVENAFGIMCSNFLCLAKTMLCGAEKAQKIIRACCLLHNFLLSSDKGYCPSGMVDTYNANEEIVEGDWRKNVPVESLFNSCVRFAQGRHSGSAKHARDVLKNNFNSPSDPV